MNILPDSLFDYPVEHETWTTVKIREQIISEFEISIHGQIRTRFTHQIVNQSYAGGIKGKSYPSVAIRGHGSHYVHRLMAWSFLPAPTSAQTQVNHKDGTYTNNYIGNLEWCTASENCLHAHKLGLINKCCGMRHRRAKLTDEQVLEIKQIFARGDKNPTQIGRDFGVDHSAIRDIISGRRYSPLG